MNLDIFDGMKGKLTRAHIDKGVRDMCRECPVALSISDMLAEHKRADDGIIVEVGSTQVRLHTTVFDRLTPTEAQPRLLGKASQSLENAGDYEAPFLVAQMDALLAQWIDDFDKGKKVPTGEIYIERDGFITDVEKVFDRLTPTEAQPVENSGGLPATSIRWISDGSLQTGHSVTGLKL